MKKNIVCTALLIFLISGCSFDVRMVTPAPASAGATLPPVTPIAFPADTPASVSTDVPQIGFTPEPNVALFYGAHAVLNPSDPPGRSAFPAGTQRIYVVWQYQNMREGLKVKRDWYLDGRLWLSREEPWDFAKYGAFGTMQDVSIYDTNVGLPSGIYQLQIYIDGLQQPIGADTMFGPELWLNFEVQPNGSVTEAASPDFKWNAVVLDGNHLIVRDTNGVPTDLYSGLEIPYFAWFPDSQHILFVDRDRSKQVATTNLGIRDQLWVADVLNRQIIPLYESETMLGVAGSLVISPDGRFIAASEGSAYGDACFVQLKMVFFELAGNFQSIRVVSQEQFLGVPSLPDSSFYPSNAGAWQSATEFVSPMKITCVVDDTFAGDYVFDVVNLKAVKK